MRMTPEMTRRQDVSSFSRFIVTAFAAVALLGASWALASLDRSKTLQNSRIAPSLADQANDALGLLKSRTIMLDVDALHAGARLVDLEVAGQRMAVELTPHSVRAPGYTVLAQQADGTFVEVEPQPVRTVIGTVIGQPGSSVAGSLLDEGLFLSIILENGENHWVEPLEGRLAGAARGTHVVYTSCDVLPHGGTCGVTAMMEAQAWQPGDDDIADGGIAGADQCRVAELAIDADFQFYQLYGSNITTVENRVNSIINTVNQQYQNQVGIRHDIVHIIVRTSSASNPYSSNNASTLLSQFRNTWNSPPESSIHRDVAHLFTGRNLGNTLGIAYLGAICNSNSYGLSTNRNNFSCATDLTAHELGHNWNASHCSCPSFTMNPSLVCANNFSADSIASIIAYRNTRTCLHNCPPPGPINNTCQSSLFVNGGSTNFSNVAATTDGPNEPNLCTFSGDSQLQSDVWFTHIAQCTGDLTISLCGSSFATKVAVYFTPCPTQPGTAAACDVSSCPSSSRSEVIVPVTQGQPLRIRVGGVNGAQGNGVLTLTCTANQPACPADINDDGAVDVNDLLILLGSWGQCAGCPADLNNDGNVDVNDLLVLLGSWGSCP